MSRREALGCLLLLTVLATGRLVRQLVLLDPAGGWRDPGWLAAYLPEAAAPPVAAFAPALPAPDAAPLLIDPNTCPADSLCLLPGIGPALAERLLAARAAGVHFARARDLQAVRGIGPRTIERLAPYLVFVNRDSASEDNKQTARSQAPADDPAGNCP
jgi:pimeloyl-ACP methyl ester carboxylesterase